MKSIRNLAGDGTTQEKLMGKPSGKQSKRVKNNGAQDKKSKTEKPVAVKVAKPVKVPGPRPESYTPKATHEERRQVQLRQDFARKVNEAGAFFPAFTAGVHGQYLIGYSAGDEIEAHSFEVKEIVLPAKGEKPENKFLAIQEVRDDGRNVFIPHEWLFHSSDDRRYANGTIGEIQCGMLCFLQRTLCVEIKSIKHRRWKERQTAEQARAAEERAEQLAQAQAERSAQIAASKNVVPIQDAILEQDCMPLRDLVPGKQGLYSLPDEQGQMIVELQHKKPSNVFRVKKISPDHHLSEYFVEGSVIGINDIARTAPQLDSHIRGLLVMAGINLKNFKPRHDKRALVTEGLPNFNEETLLAA